MNTAVDARSSHSAAKRSAGISGPSGSSSKKLSVSRVVDRAVDHSRENIGTPVRSHAITETMPERESSSRIVAAPGAVGVAAERADDRGGDIEQIR